MIAQVALPLPIPKTFTYRVPPALEPYLKPYVRVRVPFAKRSLTGFVVTVGQGQEDTSFKPVDISQVIDLVPVVDSGSFALCSWAASHYCTALGLTLKASFPLGADLERYLIVTAEGRDLLGVNGLRLKRAYAIAGKEKIWEYCHKGLLTVGDVFTGEPLEIRATPRSSRFSATLFLSDVENRCEYYLSLAMPALESGSNVLMLLPDHGVAGEHFHRVLKQRLGDRVVYFGSRTPAKRRAEVYLRLRKQGGYLVVGTRSCLFLPVNRTGLILVERPEDDGYRNDQTPQFNAVTMAGKQAELQKIPICYGSVSPPLDLMKGVEEGRIVPITRLPEKKQVETISLKKYRAGGGAPPELTDLVAGGLALNERIVIHTPLKDYAARLYCLSCHRPILCPSCDSAVSFRKEDNRLVCWRCGCQSVYDERCKHCGSALIGFGSTGAEHVVENISLVLPDARVVKMTGDVVRTEGVDGLIDTLNRPKTIVVGTQILSRFYDIGTTDRLILVGWEDFLRIAGYRAREYMYQTYCNLVDALRPAKVHLLGIAGVREPAEVLAMKGENFYREELERRKIAEFPPYLRLFLLKINAPNKTGAASAARRARGLLEEHGLQDSIIGEAMRFGARGSLTMLLKHQESLPEDLLYDLQRVRYLRIEADPSWV